MTHLKALLLCEDVRVEVGGTLTLVGVFGERLVVADRRPGADGVEVPRLAVVAIASGLRGLERVAFRIRMRRLEEVEPEPPVLAFEAHDPAMDEHTFVVIHAPVVMPGVGGYEVMFELDARNELTMHRARFLLERA